MSSFNIAIVRKIRHLIFKKRYVSIGYAYILQLDIWMNCKLYNESITIPVSLIRLFIFSPPLYSLHTHAYDSRMNRIGHSTNEIKLSRIAEWDWNNFTNEDCDQQIQFSWDF